MYDFVPYGDNWAVLISNIIQLEKDKSNAADVMEFAQPDKPKDRHLVYTPAY